MTPEQSFEWQWDDPHRHTDLHVINTPSKFPAEIEDFLLESHTALPSFQWKVQKPPSPPSLFHDQFQNQNCIREATIKNFFPDRGFGFLNTQDGDLFFHAASYREPRFSKRDGVYRIEWKQLRSDRKHRSTQPSNPKQDRTPLPVFQIGERVLYQAHVTQGKRDRANLWCLESMYNSAEQDWVKDNVQTIQAINRLPHYQLRLWVKYTEADVVHTLYRTLFEGNNLKVLQGWYAKNEASLRRLEASEFAERAGFVLSHRFPVESPRSDNGKIEVSHWTDWEALPSKVLHDFLSMPLEAICA